MKYVYFVLMEITFTPISTKRPSMQYYNELCSEWRWSDGKHNRSKVGHLFAFYFHKQKVVFHRIVDIKSSEDKYSHWSYPGDQDRNILLLSEPLHTIPWEEWVALRGPQSRMSTYTTAHLNQNRPLLYDYLSTVLV